MRNYSNENDKPEPTKKVEKTTKNGPLDVAWEVKTGEVREIQRQKAQDIAKAIICGKKSNKLAEIFQVR